MWTNKKIQVSQKPFETMCSPLGKFCAGDEIANIKNSNIQGEKKNKRRPKQTFGGRKKTNQKSLANSPRCTKSQFMSPLDVENISRVLSSFVIQSQRFLPRFILFSLFFYSTVEPLFVLF